MKNYEVINLLRELRATDWNTIRSAKVQYAVVRNIDKFESEEKRLIKTTESLKPPKLTELQGEIRPVVMAAIDKARKDEPDISNASVAALEKTIIEEWDKREEWDAVVAEYNTTIEDLYNEENDTELYQLTYDSIEQLEIEHAQMKVLYKLLK
jgi:hypothetical protein